MPFGIIHDGEAVEIVPGYGFTTYQIKVSNEEEAAWTMAPIGSVVDFEVNHPANALEHYSTEDRQRFLIQEFAEGPAAPDGHILATRALVNTGGNISVAVTYAPAPAAPIPAEVSMMQAQLALDAAGKLDPVEAAVAAADATTKIYWKTAPSLHRDHPVVAALGAAIGLTSGEIDALFVAASAIT